jgi:hypothetical protein
MVEAERHDMLEPRPDVAQEHRARALGQNLGTRQRRGQFPTCEKPFVGILPTADLARDEGAPTGCDTDLHARVPGRQVGGNRKDRIPGQVQIAGRRNLQIGDLGHHPFAIHEDQQTLRHPRPCIAQRRLQRLGPQRAQPVVDRGLRCVVRVVHRRQVDPGDQRLQRDPERDRHLVPSDLHIRDGRADFMRCRRSNRDRQDH